MYYLTMLNYFLLIPYPASYLIMINLCVDDHRKDIVTMVPGAESYKEQAID